MIYLRMGLRMCIQFWKKVSAPPASPAGIIAMQVAAGVVSLDQPRSNDENCEEDSAVADSVEKLAGNPVGGNAEDRIIVEHVAVPVAAPFAMSVAESIAVSEPVVVDAEKSAVIDAEDPVVVETKEPAAAAGLSKSTQLRKRVKEQQQGREAALEITQQAHERTTGKKCLAKLESTKQNTLTYIPCDQVTTGAGTVALRLGGYYYGGDWYFPGNTVISGAHGELGVVVDQFFLEGLAVSYIVDKDGLLTRPSHTEVLKADEENNLLYQK